MINNVMMVSLFTVKIDLVREMGTSIITHELHNYAEKKVSKWQPSSDVNNNIVNKTGHYKTVQCAKTNIGYKTTINKYETLPVDML